MTGPVPPIDINLIIAASKDNIPRAVKSIHIALVNLGYEKKDSNDDSTIFLKCVKDLRDQKKAIAIVINTYRTAYNAFNEEIADIDDELAFAYAVRDYLKNPQTKLPSSPRMGRQCVQIEYLFKKIHKLSLNPTLENWNKFIQNEKTEDIRNQLFNLDELDPPPWLYDYFSLLKDDYDHIESVMKNLYSYCSSKDSQDVMGLYGQKDCLSNLRKTLSKLLKEQKIEDALAEIEEMKNLLEVWEDNCKLQKVDMPQYITSSMLDELTAILEAQPDLWAVLDIATKFITGTTELILAEKEALVRHHITVKNVCDYWYKYCSALTVKIESVYVFSKNMKDKFHEINTHEELQKTLKKCQEKSQTLFSQTGEINALKGAIERNISRFQYKYQVSDVAMDRLKSDSSLLYGTKGYLELFGPDKLTVSDWLLMYMRVYYYHKKLQQSRILLTKSTDKPIELRTDDDWGMIPRLHHKIKTLEPQVIDIQRV